MFDKAEVIKIKNTLTDLDENKYKYENELRGLSLNFDFIKRLLAAAFGIKDQEGSLNLLLSSLQVKVWCSLWHNAGVLIICLDVWAVVFDQFDKAELIVLNLSWKGLKWSHIIWGRCWKLNCNSSFKMCLI